MRPLNKSLRTMVEVAEFSNDVLETRRNRKPTGPGQTGQFTHS
jgi:hypothetical protein